MEAGLRNISHMLCSHLVMIHTDMGNDTLASFSPEECEQLLRLNAKYNQTLRSRLSNLEEDL